VALFGTGSHPHRKQARAQTEPHTSYGVICLLDTISLWLRQPQAPLAHPAQLCNPSSGPREAQVRLAHCTSPRSHCLTRAPTTSFPPGACRRGSPWCQLQPQLAPAGAGEVQTRQAFPWPGPRRAERKPTPQSPSLSFCGWTVGRDVHSSPLGQNCHLHQVRSQDGLQSQMGLTLLGRWTRSRCGAEGCWDFHKQPRRRFPGAQCLWGPRAPRRDWSPAEWFPQWSSHRKPCSRGSKVSNRASTFPLPTASAPILLPKEPQEPRRELIRRCWAGRTPPVLGSPGYNPERCPLGDVDFGVCGNRGVLLELSREIIGSYDLTLQLGPVLGQVDFVEHWDCHAQIATWKEAGRQRAQWDSRVSGGSPPARSRQTAAGPSLCAACQPPPAPACTHLQSSPRRCSAWASWSSWRCSAHTWAPPWWHTPTSQLGTAAPRRLLPRTETGHRQAKSELSALTTLQHSGGKTNTDRQAEGRQDPAEMRPLAREWLAGEAGEGEGSWHHTHLGHLTAPGKSQQKEKHRQGTRVQGGLEAPGMHKECSTSSAGGTGLSAPPPVAVLPTHKDVPDSRHPKASSRVDVILWCRALSLKHRMHRG